MRLSDELGKKSVIVKKGSRLLALSTIKEVKEGKIYILAEDSKPMLTVTNGERKWTQIVKVKNSLGRVFTLSYENFTLLPDYTKGVTKNELFKDLPVLKEGCAHKFRKTPKLGHKLLQCVYCKGFKISKRQYEVENAKRV